MSRHHELPVKREVCESSLTFLHFEMVDYYLRGHGARFFEPPESDHVEVPDEQQALAILSAKRRRIEALGHDVGGRLVERVALHRDRLEHDLDMVKFVCKDFWEAVFSKQIDVLRTNHRGLYVLTDNNFRWLSTVSSTPEHPGSPEDYVVFPCGLICGALSRLGVRCRVTAELVAMTASYKCSFNVQVIQH